MRGGSSFFPAHPLPLSLSHISQRSRLPGRRAVLWWRLLTCELLLRRHGERLVESGPAFDCFALHYVPRHALRRRRAVVVMARIDLPKQPLLPLEFGVRGRPGVGLPRVYDGNVNVNGDQDRDPCCGLQDDDGDCGPCCDCLQQLEKLPRLLRRLVRCARWLGNDPLRLRLLLLPVGILRPHVGLLRDGLPERL